jgi:CIC family chloride channel protein
MDEGAQTGESAEPESTSGAQPVSDSRVGHLIRAAIVGLAAGGIAVAFQFALRTAEHGRHRVFDLLAEGRIDAWVGWLGLPAGAFVIGCLIGLSVKHISPDAPGSGIPHIKAVLLNLRQLKWKSLLPVKFIGGALGIGAGLSLGREGPTVQMGAAAGQAVAEIMGVKRRGVPQLVSCGAGAGLAAAFNAPLAGFVFVIEEMQREMSSRTYAGALVATVCATIVTRSVVGQGSSFAITGYPALPLTSLPLVVLLGATCGLMGVLFNKGILASARIGRAQRVVPGWMLPGVVCATACLVGLVMPDAVGSGHSVAERLLGGQMQATIGALAVLLAAKTLMTLLSYGTAAPGGIFAPMLLLGALVGAIVGQATAAVFPAIGDRSAALAVLGMAAFFASSVRAPLTGIVLILEMTANYEQLFALSVACLTAYLVAEQLRDLPIYEALMHDDLTRRGHSPDPTAPTTVVIGVQRGSRVEGRPLREAGLPRKSLVVAVERAGRELMPTADLVVAPGDHITVLVPADDPGMALRVVDLCRQA